MHGQYITSKIRQLIIEEGTFLWLSNGDLKTETESEIYRHKKRHYKEHVMEQKYYKQRHMANAGHLNFEETVDHIISPRSILNIYIYIYFNLTYAR